MSAPRHALVLTALLALVAAACGSSGSEGATGVRPDPSPLTSGSDRPAAEVLRFSAPRLGGGTVDGEDFAGEDVAFWFWAPW